MPITPLPTPPSRNDPSSFSVRADAFFAALPNFVTEFNAMVPAAFAASVTGSLSVTGNISLGSASNNTLTIRSGSASLPALIPNGDTNTGLWFPADNTVAFSTTGVERMRLDPAGAALFGASSLTPGDDTTAWVGMSSSTVTLHAPNNSTTGLVLESFYRGSVQIGSISQSGTTAVLYNTTSDRRLKTNISDAPDAGPVIDKLMVRSFDWKEPGNDRVQFGFIAQELADLFPDAVKRGDGRAAVDKAEAKKKGLDPNDFRNFDDSAVKDGRDIGESWAYDPSKLVPLLVKEVQSLRARVAALELLA